MPARAASGETRRVRGKEDPAWIRKVIDEPVSIFVPLLAPTVRTALVGIVLWGTLAGSMLPLPLRPLGIDPATSSAPFVATLVDVSGLVIYFSVAALILRGTLL